MATNPFGDVLRSTSSVIDSVAGTIKQVERRAELANDSVELSLLEQATELADKYTTDQLRIGQQLRKGTLLDK